MKILISLCLAFTLAACGTSSADPSTSPSDSPNASLSPTGSYSPKPRTERVPAKCEDTGMLELMNSDFGFKKLAYIPEPDNYVPTPDLPIYPVLVNGGTVCVTANNDEQFGMYVFWTEDDGTIFDSQVSTWETGGYKSTQIPGINSDRQLLLVKEPTQAAPDGLISVTFLNDGIWIRIDAFWGPNATFTPTLDAIKPIISKAIAATN